MESGKVKIRYSLVTRFGLFFIGLIILAIFASGILIYERASTIIASFSKERISHSSNLAEQSFFSLLTEVENDISIMSESSKLQAYANAPSNTLRKEIEDLFYITLKNKPNYFQVRLISIVEHGQEIIRLDKQGKQIKFTEKEKLQNKNERPYFQEALKLDLGELYFSPISLNEEFGEVSPSLTPTIRAISLISDSNSKPTAMVVINIDLSAFYKNLRSIMATGIQLMLVDQDGQYLFAPDMAKCFSKQLKSDEKFGADFDRSMEHLQTDSIRFENLNSRTGSAFIMQIKSLSYSKNQHRIFLVTGMSKEKALTSVLEVKKYSYWIIPVVSIIALVIAIIFIRLLAIRIGSITQAMGNYEQESLSTITLSGNRRDELGVLARTFTKMKSRINQQVKDLQNSLDKEQKAIREKDEFLQNMSHELRTPLNAIMGLTQLIKKNKPNPEQEPIVDAIHRSAQSLAGLMYDILDHQKLLEGRVELKYIPASFANLLSDIHASYRFEAINKGLDFELEIDPKLKTKRHQTDPLRFSQIITNLVVNAIKFTDSGTVTLAGKIENTGSLVVSITDTGDGILPENLEKIRDRFYQENNTSTNTQSGFGLGLSIVKQLVGLFGGQLNAQSEKGKGATFSVTLPLSEVDQQASFSIDKMGNTPLPDFAKPKTILHIEDDESARLLVNQLFLSPTIEVIQTNHLAYAKQVLEKQSPDLIISDLMLENHHIGNELIQIKEEHQIPIIVVSALEERQMQEISENCLQKPFDVEHLIDLTIVQLGRDAFDHPQLATSYAQYDNESVKIKKFLTLLISEFETYLERIDRAFESQDETEWIAIRHKLITHIRSLALSKLNEALPENLNGLNSQTLKSAKNLLLYDLSYFRNELRSL